MACIRDRLDQQARRVQRLSPTNKVFGEDTRREKYCIRRRRLFVVEVEVVDCESPPSRAWQTMIFLIFVAAATHGVEKVHREVWWRWGCTGTGGCGARRSDRGAESRMASQEPGVGHGRAGRETGGWPLKALVGIQARRRARVCWLSEHRLFD